MKKTSTISLCFAGATALFGTPSKIKKLLLLLIFLAEVQFSMAQAPGLSWIRTYGGSDLDAAESVAIDTAGNVYTTGAFRGTAVFGSTSLTSAGTGDIYLSKTDRNGTILWAKRFGGPNGDKANEMITDAAGNIYLVGDFTNSATFGTFTLNTGGDPGTVNIFVMKVNPSGVVSWVKKFGGTTTYSGGQSITLDPSGNIHICGRFAGGTLVFGSTTLTGTNSEAYQAKLDPNGNALWANRYGGGLGDLAYAITTDAAGNSYVTGRATLGAANPVFGSFTLTAGGTNSILSFILKVSPSGTVLWAKGCDYAEGMAICIDAGGNIYVGHNATDFPVFGSYTSGSRGGYDVFITKMSPAGTVLWVEPFGSTLQDFVESITADAAGNTYIAANFGGPAILPSGTFPAGIYVIKLDTSGNILWVKRSGDADDYGIGIGINSTGDIYFTGSFTGTALFDATTLTSDGDKDIFLAKLAGPCSPTSSTLTQTACNSITLNAQTYTTSGTYTQTLVNAAGCDSTLTINLTIEDLIAPVANIANLTDVAAQCSVTSLTAPTATDCAGTITGTNNATFPITTQGTTVVTWTYDDGHGNTTTQTQNVIINDNTAPVANVANLADVTAQCSITSLTAPTAGDNCAGTITGTTNATLPITTQGTTVVTWTYDDGHGNTTTQTQNVIINDNTAPVANVANLADVTVQCSVASLTAPTADDNCTGTITGTTATTLPITTQGTIVVTWTYDDGHGNTSTQTQNVIINDNTAPVANVANLPDVTAQCSVASLTAPTADDNCTGTITGTTNATFPITTQGTTIVTWTYDDGHGNTSTQTQNIIITDNTSPVANTANLADVTAQCSVASLTAPTADDNCAGTITGTNNITFPITTQGTTVVTWTYDDGHGNTSTQTQNVIITDNTAPVANVANLADVTAQCSVVSLTAPTADDNCAGTITGTTNAAFPITAEGTTIVTWTYDDGHGNTTTQTQNVIITIPDATTTLSGLTITANNPDATYQWIDCTTSNPLAGETDQSFTAAANGSYAVIVTENSCSATSACVVISSVGVNENTAVDLFNLYPNPTNGSFIVESAKPIVLTVTNTVGQIILKQELQTGKSTVQLDNVESGIYFITGTDEDQHLFIQRLSVIR